MIERLLILFLFGISIGLFCGCGRFEPRVINVDGRGYVDPYVVVDRAVINLTGKAESSVRAQYVGSTAPSLTIAVTYNNAATAVGFALNTASLVAGSFTSDLLSFGSFAISGLNDNKLKVCPSLGEANNGTVKCNRAKIRIYSLVGDADGVFSNTMDGYYIPIAVAGINVGVGVANAAYVQTYNIPNNKNRLKASDLLSQVSNFPVVIDFNNGGAGSYSASLVVEYVLSKE